MSAERFFSLLAVCAAALTFSDTGAAQVVLHGAGSTMAANYVDALRSASQASQTGSVHYDAVGSGEGIRRIATGGVDFALTDIPLTEFELEQLRLTQTPLFYCGVVVVVNLPGIGDGALRLSDKAVSAIFAGEISRWRDPEVLRTNEGASVPDLPIIVVHRTDTSGTSFVFTSFLSAASQTWANRFGLGSRLSWPTGQAADGSAGVRDAVRRRPGAIGYLEYGNALQARLATVQLESGKGDFVRPGRGSFRLAITARLPTRASGYQVLTRSLTAGAWPILATEYGLIDRNERTNPAHDAVVRFLDRLASSSTLGEFQFLSYDARAGNYLE